MNAACVHGSIHEHVVRALPGAVTTFSCLSQTVVGVRPGGVPDATGVKRTMLPPSSRAAVAVAARAIGASFHWDETAELDLIPKCVQPNLSTPLLQSSVGGRSGGVGGCAAGPWVAQPLARSTGDRARHLHRAAAGEQAEPAQADRRRTRVPGRGADVHRGEDACRSRRKRGRRRQRRRRQRQRQGGRKKARSREPRRSCSHWRTTCSPMSKPQITQLKGELDRHQGKRHAF